MSADYILVISHARRMQINGVMNRLAFQEYNGPYIEIARPDKFKGKNQPQDYYCFPGQVLIGHSDCSKEIVNGSFYRVEAVAPDEVTLFAMDLGYELIVPINTMETRLRLAHALAYASVQGRTFREAHVRLWDTTHKYFSKTHLLVGISRATAGRYVDVGAE